MPFVFISLLAFGGGATACYAWHTYQLQRISGTLLQNAQQLVRAQRIPAAVATFDLYLRIHPKDRESRIALARAYDGSDPANRELGQAIRFYRAAVLHAPDQVDCRARLLELHLEAGELEEAVDTADDLLERFPSHPEGLRLKAIALHRLVPQEPELGKAADDALSTAVQTCPADVELALAYVNLHERHAFRGSRPPKPAPAEVLDRLVAAQPRNPLAYLARHRFRRNINRLQAEEDLQTARRYGPNHPQVLYALGEDALQRRAWNEANEAFEQARQLDPADAAIYVGLGDSCWALGRFEEARAHWQAGSEVDEEPIFPLVLRLGGECLSRGDVESAHAILKQLDGILGVAVPSEGEFEWHQHRRSVDLLWVRYLLARNELRAAMERMRTLLAMPLPGSEPIFQPRRLEIEHLLTVAYGHAGQWDIAAERLDQAAKLRPALAGLWLASARAWARAGWHEQAIARCERALEDPRSADMARLLIARLELERQLTRPLVQVDLPLLRSTLADAELHCVHGFDRYVSSDWKRDVAGIPPNGERIVESLLDQSHAQDLESLLRSMVVAYDRVGGSPDPEVPSSRLRQFLSENHAVPEMRSDQLHHCGETAAEIEWRTSQLANLPPFLLAPALEELAELERQRGNPILSRQYLLEWLKVEPNNFRVPRLLGHLALDTDSADDARTWEKRLRQLEGEEGTEWRFLRTARLVRQGAEDVGWPEAIIHQEYIAGIRPFWIDGLQLGQWIADRAAHNTTAPFSETQPPRASAGQHHQLSPRVPLARE